MTCFCVKFYVTTPIVTRGMPLHLDALLGAIKMKLEGRHDPAPWQPLDLPFLKREGRVTPYYKASAWEMEEKQWHAGSVVKSMSWVDRDIRLGRAMENARGKYRLFQENFRLICAPVVTFYGDGDPEQVYNLLKKAEGALGIGALTRIGYGQVGGFEILPAGDYSVWDQLGRPARFIPIAELKAEQIPRDAIKVVVPCTPPYWYSPYRVMCLAPPPDRWQP